VAATTKTKFPKQLYVVSQNRPEYEYPDPGNYQNKIETPHNFGFLHPHEPHLKPDASRKETQIRWAYSHGEPYQIGDQWWIKGNEREYDYNTRQWMYHPFDHMMDPRYAPRVWDNEPLTGFQIIDTVNRYRGNKLFKVMDPRGVEFEITASSLFQLLMDGAVDKGVITVPCLWKANKNLVVA
jgi:hypothetical protein